MDPDMINCMILRIHVDKKIIPNHAIQRRTSVSARYGSRKKKIIRNQLSWTGNQKFCKPTGMPGPIGVQILDPTEQYLTS